MKFKLCLLYPLGGASGFVSFIIWTHRFVLYALFWCNVVSNIIVVSSTGHAIHTKLNPCSQAFLKTINIHHNKLKSTNKRLVIAWTLSETALPSCCTCIGWVFSRVQGCRPSSVWWNISALCWRPAAHNEAPSCCEPRALPGERCLESSQGKQRISHIIISTAARLLWKQPLRTGEEHSGLHSYPNSPCVD